jgi:hypothetical protein
MASPSWRRYILTVVNACAPHYLESHQDGSLAIAKVTLAQRVWERAKERYPGRPRTRAKPIMAKKTVIRGLAEEDRYKREAW